MISGVGTRVLDVGCYTGDLLASLPKPICKFGVEPNVDAARTAKSRAIDILGSSIENVVKSRVTFDVVVACNVIEHVSSPSVFLAHLAAVVERGGTILVSTGDPESWFWKVLRSRFWHCYFPEHISFVGRHWCRRAGSQLGLKLESAVRFNYRGRSGYSPQAIRSLLAAFACAVAARIYRNICKSVFGRLGGFAPLGCGATKDHVLYMFVRDR
jgi:SAM-dependent methyltransferase